MTTDSDLDRRTRAWLDLMPDEVPDRAIAAVLEAIEAAPQARQPLVRRNWRPPRMNRFLLIAAAVVGVALAGGMLVAGGAFVNRDATPDASPPAMVSSPLASPIASAAPVLERVPPEVLGRWMGSPREDVTGKAGVLLTLDAGEWAFSRSNRNDERLASGWAGGADNELVLAGGSGVGCSVAGRYRWAVSPSGRALTLDAIEDGCAARAGLVTGTYWSSKCHDPGTNCLGDLDAGTYASQYITPLASAGDGWSPVFGALTYTVPDGWANWSDWPGLFGITPSSDYATTTTGSYEPARWIQVLTDARPESQATACSGSPEPGIEPTPRAFLSWLQTVPGLTVSKSHTIVVGGREGAYADIGVDDSALVGCGGDPAVEYMIAGGYPQAILSGAGQRLILLDNGNGGLVAIQVHVSTVSDFAAFAATAMPIVDGFRFQ